MAKMHERNKGVSNAPAAQETDSGLGTTSGVSARHYIEGDRRPVHNAAMQTVADLARNIGAAFGTQVGTRTLATDLARKGIVAAA